MKNLYKILSDSPYRLSSVNDMIGLGKRIGACLEPSDALALIGDLGAGKTHFVKGLAEGIGSPDCVSSPTFPIVHEYVSGDIPLMHFDFYRLDSASELEALGWDEYLDSDSILVAEWADKFPDWMPPGTIWLHFSVTGSSERIITVSGDYSE